MARRRIPNRQPEWYHRALRFVVVISQESHARRSFLSTPTHRRNRSVVRSDFFDILQEDSPSFPYSLKTCVGVVQNTRQRASGFQVRSLDSEVSLPVPNLIESNEIPDDRANILTPEAALHHSHLKRIAHLIPTLEPKTSIMLR